MSVRPARKPRPHYLDEVLRVLAIYDLLREGLAERHPPVEMVSGPPRTEPSDLVLIRSEPMTVTLGPIGEILLAAERIASRTED